MKQYQIKYIIDVGMGIMFLLCFFTGLMKWPTKASGTLSITHTITVVHDYSGIILGLFVCIHLILNWKWIINTTKKLLKKVDG